MEKRLTQSMALGHLPSAQEAAVGITHILPSALHGIPNVAVSCPAPTLLPRAVPPPQVTLLPHTDYFYLPLFANKNPSQFFCFPSDTRIFPTCVSSSPGPEAEGREDPRSPPARGIFTCFSFSGERASRTVLGMFPGPRRHYPSRTPQSGREPPHDPEDLLASAFPSRHQFCSGISGISGKTGLLIHYPKSE